MLLVNFVLSCHLSVLILSSHLYTTLAAVLGGRFVCFTTVIVIRKYVCLCSLSDILIALPLCVCRCNNRLDKITLMFTRRVKTKVLLRKIRGESDTFAWIGSCSNTNTHHLNFFTLFPLTITLMNYFFLSCMLCLI